MGDLFYKFVVWVGRHPFFISSRVTYLHRERAERAGAFILASNHFSPFDVPCLMRASRKRMLDFVSVTEVYQNPLVARFYTGMNAFPLDRSRPDLPTVRTIYDRLSKGRVIAMFPEGGLRDESNSVCLGGTMKPGVARIAQKAKAPIVPCVIVGTAAYRKPANWLPLRRVRYGINYGEAIFPKDDADETAAAKAIEVELREAYKRLYAELVNALPMDRVTRATRP